MYSTQEEASTAPWEQLREASGAPNTKPPSQTDEELKGIIKLKNTNRLLLRTIQ